MQKISKSELKTKLKTKTILSKLFTIALALCSTSVFANVNSEVKIDNETYFGNEETKKAEVTQNEFIYRNVLQEIHFDQSISFNKRMDIIDKARESNLIGKLTVHKDETLTYSGVFGDLKANNMQHLIAKQEQEKLKMIKNTLTHDDGSLILLSSNVNKYDVLNNSKIDRMIEEEKNNETYLETNSRFLTVSKELKNSTKSKASSFIIFELEDKPFLLVNKKENGKKKMIIKEI